MNRFTHIIATAAIGLFSLNGGSIFAQTITNPITSNSTSNPVSNLDQNGALINTQINSHQLGRSIVGNGIADCTTSGISASAFGSGVGPFDSGTLGGAITYTYSFGMKTCKEYAKNQLAKLRLETCLLLISNYSKMQKAGIEIDYQELMSMSDLECPAVKLSGVNITPPSSDNQSSSSGLGNSAENLVYDSDDLSKTPQSSSAPSTQPHDSRRDPSRNPNDYPNNIPVTEIQRMR